MEKVVIVSAARTAIGRFGGTLKDVSDSDLGALIIGEAIKRAGVDPSEIDETIMAHGYRTGELPINSARVMAVKGGVPKENTQFTISKACGGSIRSVTLGAQIIKAGDADIICAGGVESMSRAAYLLRSARWGYRLGHGQLQDQLILFDPLSGDTMGETAENVAEKYQVSREDQDAFGFESQERAARAIAAGKFKEQIVPVTIPQKKGEPKIFDTDEHPRQTTLEKLAKLKPAFREGGTVTAGSSSGMNDGASALVIMSESKAKEKGPDSPGQHRGLRLGRSGTFPDGHRPDPGHSKGFGQGRHDRRPDRSDRTERGFCLPVPGLYPRIGSGHGKSECQRRGHCPGPPGFSLRRRHFDQALV